jgi:hypothetical protein
LTRIGEENFSDSQPAGRLPAAVAATPIRAKAVPSVAVELVSRTTVPALVRSRGKIGTDLPDEDDVAARMWAVAT